MQGSERVFKGESVSAILEEIKETLGMDVEILDIKHISAGVVEVRVEVQSFIPLVPTTLETNQPESQNSVRPSLNSNAQAIEKIKTRPASTGSGLSAAESMLSHKAALIEKSALWANSFGGDANFTADIYDKVMQAGGDSLFQRMEAVLASLVAVDGNITFTRRFVCVLGNTGSGSSNLCFTLASKLISECNVRTGILHMDSSRDNPTEFMRSLPPTVSCPLIRMTPKLLAESCEEFVSCDLVLIDLPPIEEMQSTGSYSHFLRLVGLLESPEFVWVVDSRLNRHTLGKTLSSIRDLDISRVIISHLGAGCGLGESLQVLNQCRIPISFLATGGSFDDDIEPASYSRLAWFVTRSTIDHNDILEDQIKNPKVLLNQVGFEV